tara:strand:- start:5334 stop:5630 length:297 start_codon:yes stop_codon:yes gene_type:complete
LITPEPYVFAKQGAHPLGFNIGDIGQAQVNIEGLGAVTYDVFELLRGSNSEILVKAAAVTGDVVIVGERTITDGFVIKFSAAIATEVVVVVTGRGRNE